MSLRFSLLAGAALVLAPAVSAQNALMQTGPAGPPQYSTFESFGGIQITQNTDPSFVDEGTVACLSGDPPVANSDNGFWRAFDLADENVGGDLQVLNMNVGIRPSAADALEGIVLNVYTVAEGTDITTTIPAAALTLVGSSDPFASLIQAEPYLASVDLSVTIPADALMAVEMSLPSGVSDNPEVDPNVIVVAGRNTAGQSGPMFLTSEGCGISDPTPSTALGNFPGGWVLVINGTVATASEDGVATRAVSLGSAQPNPVAGSARMPFTLEASTAVRASVYDLLGREVAQIADRAYAAGDHELNLDAATLPAGTYVVRLQAGAESVTQMVTVVR